MCGICGQDNRPCACDFHSSQLQEPDVAGEEKPTFQKAARFFYDGMLTITNDKLEKENAQLREQLAKADDDQRAFLAKMDAFMPEIKSLESERDALRAENESLREQLAKAEKDRDEWSIQAATINVDRDRLRVALERVEKLARLKGYPTPSEWAQLLDTIREALAQSKTEAGGS